MHGPKTLRLATCVTKRREIPRMEGWIHNSRLIRFDIIVYLMAALSIFDKKQSSL